MVHPPCGIGGGQAGRRPELFESEREAPPMWSRLDEAVAELPSCPPAELFERFLKWTA